MQVKLTENERIGAAIRAWWADEPGELGLFLLDGMDDGTLGKLARDRPEHFGETISHVLQEIRRELEEEATTDGD